VKIHVAVDLRHGLVAVAGLSFLEPACRSYARAPLLVDLKEDCNLYGILSSNLEGLLKKCMLVLDNGTTVQTPQ